MRYKVDLIRYMADCEANYARLMKLFSDIMQCDERRVGFYHNGDHVLRLLVLEQTRYTTLLKLEQEPEETDVSLWSRLPVLTLRLYHDAQVTEVVSCEGVRQLRPRYEYPNKKMYHQDEKAQWNLFLGEWLSHCLEYGHHVEPLFGATI
ncbi:MAG: hypothetical protein ACI89Z_000235 [Porticoccus sp.]|jgi:uncharacterized protein YqiB (DUF1249 family)